MEKSLPERMLARLVEHKPIAYLVVLGVAVGAVSSFTDAVSKLAQFFSKPQSSSYPVTIHGFPPIRGQVTGVQFDLYLDGARVQRVSNLEGAPTVHLGSLKAGVHSYRFANIDAYLIDDAPVYQTRFSRLNCEGQFTVSGPKTYELFMFVDSAGLRCELQ